MRSVRMSTEVNDKGKIAQMTLWITSFFKIYSSSKNGEEASGTHT